MSFIVSFFIISSFFYTLTLGLLVFSYLIRKMILKHKMLKGDK